jgi:hypothetical protein
MTTVLSVLIVCITIAALAERFYKFKERGMVKTIPLNVKELEDIKEEISKLKGRLSASKIGKVMEL